jgi:hypothetical protein
MVHQATCEWIHGLSTIFAALAGAAGLTIKMFREHEVLPVSRGNKNAELATAVAPTGWPPASSIVLRSCPRYHLKPAGPRSAGITFGRRRSPLSTTPAGIIAPTFPRRSPPRFLAAATNSASPTSSRCRNVAKSCSAWLTLEVQHLLRPRSASCDARTCGACAGGNGRLVLIIRSILGQLSQLLKSQCKRKAHRANPAL